MASATDVEIPVVYVRWEIDTSVGTSSSNPLTSSDFRFLKNETKFQFYYARIPYGHTYKNECHLQFWVPSGWSSFVAFVHVEEYETGRIRTQLSQKTRFSSISYNNHYTIWRMADADLQRAVPIYRNYQKLRFLVVLKKDDVLTDMDSKETQTECYLPEAVGQTSCSTTSKSIQTSLLHSISPCLESLSEDLAQLMVHQDSDPDMEFLCGGQSTRAHKLIVCSRSPVIARMMASDMVEGRSGVVTIPNMEPDVFRTFLGYLYSGKLGELSFDAALTLYEIGNQYAVRSLAKRCLQYLMEHLSVDNACEVLVVVDAHGDSEIIENIIEYILENKIPLVSDQWSGFCDDHPKLANKVLSLFYKKSMNIGEN